MTFALFELYYNKHQAISMTWCRNKYKNKNLIHLRRGREEKHENTGESHDVEGLFMQRRQMVILTN